MTGNGCFSFYVPIKYELKSPSEVMPGLLVIQIQIQAMCPEMIKMRGFDKKTTLLAKPRKRS